MDLEISGCNGKVDNGCNIGKSGGHLSEAPPPVGRHAVGDPGRDPVGDSHRHGVGHQGLARGAAAGEHNLGTGE